MTSTNKKNDSPSKKITIHDPIICKKQDILKRRSIAQKILQRLRNDDCPPVLGLYGGWGTGKTSVLNLLQEVNAEKKKLKIITIDAWQYETMGSLLAPVIVKLKKQIKDSKYLPQAWKSIWRIGFRVALTSSVSALSKVDIDNHWKRAEEKDSQDAPAILRQWEKIVDDVEEAREAFSRLVDLIIKEKKCERLLIVVDNLDRCSPENVVSFFESIKNFMSVENCTWLLAMDSEVITSYINRKYEGTALDGYSYLDKIVPEQYHLSSLSPANKNEGGEGDLIQRLLDFAMRGGNTEEINNLRFIQTDMLPEIPRILVPRRLIKSARKFAEYQKLRYEVASDEIVLPLILLYHGWPDFYERLSFTPREYLFNLFINFVPELQEDKDKEKVMPLDKKFLGDQELVYFFKRIFKDVYTETDAMKKFKEIWYGIESLRLTGLP